MNTTVDTIDIIDIIDMMEPENINLLDLSLKINNLGKEENKKNFLKNYNDYKTIIEIIDQYLKNNNLEINYDDIELVELFKLLDKISNLEDIKKKNLKELIHIKKIIESIENKINLNHTITKIN
jgi:hypothetical protein